MILYGRNAVAEAVRAGRRTVHQIWATDKVAAEPWLAGDPRVSVTNPFDIAHRAESDSHQGVCADVEAYHYAGAAELLAARDPLILALDEVQDPQNLGAICRSAECAGVTGVVIPERRAAEVTPAVCRASAGAVEWLRLARVRNLADFLAEAKAAGCWTYGAAAGPESTSYLEPDWTGGVVLVMGAEGKGLRPRVAQSCDALVALPLNGRVASLNVSAAAAALLYGILHRRQESGSGLDSDS